MSTIKPVPDLYADVGAFHEKFGLDVGRVAGRLPTTKPNLLPLDVQEFREKFMQEELDEFHDAFIEVDLPKAADALVDLIYVALGTAHKMGLDFNAHWALVHEKNMQKERATSAGDDRSKRGHSLDVVKPAGWTPPDHAPLLTKTANDFSYVYEQTNVD